MKPRTKEMRSIDAIHNVSVLATCSYIDTVVIQQKPYFRRDAIKFYLEHSNAYGPEEKETYGGRVLQQFDLHQPQPEIFSYLTDKVSKITFVAIALDLLTQERHDARELQRRVVQGLMPHAKPFEAVHREGATAYFGFHRAELSPGISVAVYSDRPSKVAGSPCCHIEWRVKGAKKLRELGLREPHNLLALDHNRFWRAMLDIVEVPSHDALGATYMKAHAAGKHGGSRQFPYGSRTQGIERIGSLFLRPLYDDLAEVTSANDLALEIKKRKKSFPGVSIKSLFPSVDVEPWLPLPNNALWPVAAQ
jgi:hypothetical protein